MTPDGPYVSTGLSICLQRREIFMRTPSDALCIEELAIDIFFFSLSLFNLLLLVK